MKIYIAAPFFNPQQLTRVMLIEELISSLPGYTYFSPRSEGTLQDMPPEERMAKMESVFQSNVDNVKRCDLIVALLDDKDTGTTWEMGMAYGNSTNVIGVSFEGKAVNVMLQYGMRAYCKSVEELRETLLAYLADEQPLPHAIKRNAEVY